MVAKILFALAALAALSGDSSKAGEAWLGKAEPRLYRWPRPGGVVRFQVKTDVLDGAIEAMEKDPALGSDPEKVRFVDALKRASITSAVDTETGLVTTDVDVHCELSDPRAKASVEKLKSSIASLVTGAFQGLPLHDPSLLARGSSVVASEEQGDSIAIQVTGRREGEQTTIHVNRQSMLPERFDMPAFTMHYRYVEVVPGRFAPSRFEVRQPSGTPSRGEYTYQRAGDLVFPSTIRVSRGTQTATLSFVSVKIEPRGH